MRKREEAIPHSDSVYCGQYRRWTYPPGDFLPWAGGAVYYDADGLLRPHLRLKRCYDELHSGPPYRTGGPLNIWEVTDDMLTPVNVGSFYDGYRYYYDGGFVCSVRPCQVFDMYDLESLGEPGFSGSDYGDVADYGPTGWNKYAPGKSTADLGVFLAELADLPKMLRTTAKGFHDVWRAMGGSRTNFGPKKVADHWLNTQFGWLPFLNDMRKFYNTYKKLDRKIEFIRRNNGRWIKRGGTVTEDEDFEVLSESSTQTRHYPVLYGSFYASGSQPGSYSIRIKTTRLVWFEGRFRYWIPNVESPQWRQKAVRLLFGGTISPAVLWEATPWSWLADWFTNAGDVIANMDTGWAENLASKYAYVMGTTEKSVDVSSSIRLKGGTHSHDWSFSLTRKTRVAANPFGFGLTWDDLSLRQLSILGALGISRTRPAGG